MDYRSQMDTCFFFTTDLCQLLVIYCKFEFYHKKKIILDHTVVPCLSLAYTVSQVKESMTLILTVILDSHLGNLLTCGRNNMLTSFGYSRGEKETTEE